jgi:late competence protein required for DNA uptake (superfamily II DNA/RNA helicase)
LIYVNDFPTEINEFCSISQYADDTATWTAAYTHCFAVSKLQKALNFVEGWCRRWRVKINGEKSKLLLISRLREKPTENYSVLLFDDVITPVTQARFLGVEFDQKLNFEIHILEICGRANRRLNVLRALARAGTKANVLMKLYEIYIRPLMEYGSISFMAAPKHHLKKLQQIQNEALRICLRLPRYISIDLLHEYGCCKRLNDRFQKLNKKLLTTMSENNENVMEIVTQHQVSNILSSHRSSLDMLSE